MISPMQLAYAGVKLALVAFLWIRGRKQRREDLQAIRKEIRHDQVVLARFLRDEIHKINSNAGASTKNN